MISLYDTATQQVVPLAKRDPGKVSMYVCGPTVYAPPHIGHGRMVLVYDILRRYLTWTGLDVHHVSNVTDIDDQIIRRAQQEDRTATEIAVKCEKIWWQAMDRLGVLRPVNIPHATEYVDGMIELIAQLVERDAAYPASDGIYLSVEKVEGYGLLNHQSLDDLREGGGDRDIVGVDKRHPADFALWKLAKEGEPSWPSPWGDGRPGWHTECVVMSLDLLGEGFDLHSGGLDLVFPHHENERAQAVALGRPFANHWMHHGFIEMGGEKMSKSLGNVMNLLDLMDAYDPRAYRLLILRSHYRSPIEVTDASMSDAVAALARLDAFARRTDGLEGMADPDVLDQFRAIMDRDLDTPGAIDLLFRQVREANTALDAADAAAAGRAAATAREIARAVGLVFRSGADSELPAQVLALAEQRQAARAAKDWALADQLRDQMTAAGYTVEDTPNGAVVRPT
ncbi:MAG: cysteine--tRNA ligase [Acidimicrobiia bacterium]|nr:cysteine--tRNA ligase [Acidimicrobiia bacterium]